MARASSIEKASPNLMAPPMSRSVKGSVRARLLPWVALLALSACAAPAARTEVLVVVDADQAVRAESVKLRVIVRGGRGVAMGVLDDRFFRDFDVTPHAGWPVEVALIPLDGDVGRVFEVEAAGIDVARREVTLVRARSGFVAGHTLMLRLHLEDTCRGVVCTTQQTCRAGACEDVPLTPPESLPPYDPIPADGGPPMPTVCTTDTECDDAVFCNGRERCLDGACAPGTRVVCDDGVACTRDVCRGNSCVGEPDDTMCTAVAGGRCAGATGCQYDVCTASTCASDARACETAACSGSTCQRTSTCATGQTCCGGSCGPAGCDDGNECTLDSCEASGCVHTARAGVTCNDGDSCTAGDVCGNDGACAGAPRDCDDGNACTDDACVAGAGCVNTPNSGTCDDHNACTSGDRCVGTVCVPGASCDDGVACTEDRCFGGECTYGANPALCTAAPGGTCNATTGCQYPTCTAATCAPANACETASCMGDVCVRGPIACPGDGNPCTDDGCNPAVGCQNIPNAAACDDSNPCTIGDQCSGGGCTGAANPCEDGNACTDTSCNQATGCTFAPAAGAACGPVNACESSLCSAMGTCQLFTVVCDTRQCESTTCDSMLGCRYSPAPRVSCCDGAQMGVCMSGSCITALPGDPVPALCDGIW